MNDEIRKLQMQINDLQSKLAYMQTIRDTWLPTGGWTYASASTVKEPGDVTALYPTGTKVRWYQSAWKYGYIVGSSYSSPHTTLTIAGNTVSNAAVVTPAFSYASTPPGFTHRFTFDPSPAADGSMTYTSVTVAHAHFAIVGKTIVFSIYMDGTTGGTASTGITWNLPISTGGIIHNFATTIRDSTTMLGYSTTFSGTALVTSRRLDTANWGLGTDRNVRCSGSYTI